MPIAQVARAHFVWEPGVVWREGREWAITVQSDVVDGIQGPTVSGQIDKQLAALRASLPAGYRITRRGRGRRQRGMPKHRLPPTCRWCCSSCSRC